MNTPSDPAIARVREDYKRQVEHRPADDQSRSKAHDDKNHQQSSINVQHLVLGALDAVGLGALSVTANWLLSIGHKLWGTWFTFAAVVTGLLLPALILHWQSTKWSKLVWRTFSALTFVVFICFLVFASQIADSFAPDLRLVLERIDSANVNVPLPKSAFSRFKPTNGIKTALVIPVAAGDSNIALRFSVNNKNAEVAGDVAIAFASITNLSVVQNSFWEPDSVSDINEFAKGWSTHCVKPLYAGERAPLGPLEFPPSLRIGRDGSYSAYTAFFIIRANRDPAWTTFMCFTMVFLRNTNPTVTGIYTTRDEPTNNAVVGAAFNPTNHTFFWIRTNDHLF